jgi:formylglycine-generating enzyme required for sulfatase activity
MTEFPASDLPGPVLDAAVTRFAGAESEAARASVLQELVAANPEHADGLRELASALLGTDRLLADSFASRCNGDPDRIGAYRVQRRLGEGAFGTVYLCLQDTPVRRQVAVKVLRPGAGDRSTLARFEAERQVLVGFDHPGIASMFDAGALPDGRPFFTMEHVDGAPITDYCDRRRLPIDARLQLFIELCDGVQHAHVRGIVHRDLKPGNVLVAERDGKAVPKIIDFGIAKALQAKPQQSGATPTATGQVVGTPGYMSPEQAAGDLAAVDTRADVFALGVMLYELLTGDLPWSKSATTDVPPPRPSARVQSDPARTPTIAGMRSTAPRTLASRLRGDLDWIVLKAIEKQRKRRYESANALAQDLARHLAHEPVLAGPPSAAYRLRKLLRRHRAAAIATAVVLVALLAGGIGTFVQYVRAEGKVAEFDQLAGVVLYERAIAKEQELHPPWPHKIEAMETWLREDCGELLAMRSEIERTVASLRARSLPQSEAEKRNDRESHPRFAEFRRAEQRVASLRRAQAIRAGAPLVVPELSAEQQALEATKLNSLAWARVAPNEGERRIYGEEALGLACARAAVAKAADADRPALLDTLAWALLANGQDDDARAQSATALAVARANEKAEYEGYQRDIAQAIASTAATLAVAERDCATLAAAVAARANWTFAPDDEATDFLHDTLCELLDKLARLESSEKISVQQRLRWARAIEDLSIVRHRARWEEARAAIRTSERYRAHPIDLRPLIGLVPIGENPVTGLWEFYELRSAWDGTTDPANLAIPAHRPDGTIEVAAETGIVFVLLPGGTFAMGAQRTNEELANFDPQAQSQESPVHEVTLAPFFLARHELTKGQWQRLSGGEEPSWYRIGRTYPGNPDAIGYTHAVENVNWTDSEQLLRQHGMTLPTEAQWEYGGRAGTSTPWWPGPSASDLEGCANVMDQTGGRFEPSWHRPEGDFDDGRVSLGPVGQYRANAFGLFDVHGNVWEWCLDEYGSYADPVGADNGLRLEGDGSLDRVQRGGAFGHAASGARLSLRGTGGTSYRHSTLGLRPARALAP